MKKIVPNNAVLIPDNAQRVFRGVIYDVYQWPQTMFDGSTKTFEMLKRADTVEIIAIHDNKLVVLNEEQPNLPLHYTLPAGRHDVPGETELEAAKRELLEETGMVFREWKLLSVVQPFAKTEWFVYQFLATDRTEIKAQAVEQDGEKITIMEKTLAEVKAMIKDPLNRYLPAKPLADIDSFEELASRPEFAGQIVDRSNLRFADKQI